MHPSARKKIIGWLGFTLCLIATVVGVAVWKAGGPTLLQRLSMVNQSSAVNTEMENKHDHAGHDHSGHNHAGHDEADSLFLSPQARKNLGLSGEALQPLKLSTYHQSLTFPAMVVEIPGRTRLQISTPLTGVILDVHVTTGETVSPGDVLFKIRLTHEDLVQTQTDFLKTLGELDVEQREINRLQGLSDSGAVAGKVLLEKQYTRDRLQAIRDAQREALRLHGLSPRQVEMIEKDRRLLQELDVVAISPQEHEHEELRLMQSPAQPRLGSRSSQAASVRMVAWSSLSQAQENAADDHPPELLVQDLRVHKGQTVQAGEALCELTDLSQLYLEGRAFERDTLALTRAHEQGWNLKALMETSAGTVEISDLKLAFLSNQIGVESRMLSVYVRLPNRIVQDQTNDKGQRYISWKYRPGQRMQLSVPVEAWENQFVVPVAAVAREGAESFVFQENGDHFERIPVHVKYQDQTSVVIANDGTLFEGDVIALRSAHQMLIALKNKSGGGVDPHAGHNH